VGQARLLRTEPVRVLLLVLSPVHQAMQGM
jgi:hypothetical protein